MRNRWKRLSHISHILLRYDPARAYFAASDVPQDFWPYAADHVCKLHNMLPSRSLENEISPYEQVFNRKPDLSRFRVWGCKCYFHLNDRDRLLLDSTKLDSTAVKAVHLGFDEQRLRAYHVCVPSLNRITTGYHVNFNEKQFVDLRDELQGRAFTKVAPETFHFEHSARGFAQNSTWSGRDT